MDLRPVDLKPLQQAFGARLQTGASLARYTAARMGGLAEALLEARSLDELVEVICLCWQHAIPCTLLGGGSNVLVSELGLQGLVVINRTRQVRFDEQSDPPTVWAESGVNFGALARQATQRGLGGLEWAAGIPGTLGGAVVGNAGAHGGDMAGSLVLAEILHQNRSGAEMHIQRTEWPVERLDYAYRSSILKRQPGKAVVLSARLRLERSTPQAAQARLEQYVSYRRRTQPPGASLGSMFKNPPGDYAGRLIDAAGLKGKRIGAAEISPVHANFFINRGGASATDVYALIQLARQEVAQQAGVELELEIELLGEFPDGEFLPNLVCPNNVRPLERDE